MPTTDVLRYMAMLKILSSILHLDKTQCGIRALKRRKSPGCKGNPKLGNKKKDNIVINFVFVLPF
jgi:hypothetical protein